MLHLAIVEDEQIYIDQLTGFLKKYQHEKGTEISIAVFTDGDGIVSGYAGQFDIILMDIQLPFVDGMTAAEEIRKVDPNVVIIFITNMQQYAIRGYQVDALDYIVKPVEYFSFSRKFDRAVSRVRRGRMSYITVYTGGSIYKLVTSQILYIESEGHLLHFHTMNGEIVARMTIGDAERSLSGRDFYRCGKGYLINLQKVDSYTDGICRIGDHMIPVSRAKKKEFMTVLADYLSSRLV